MVLFRVEAWGPCSTGTHDWLLSSRIWMVLDVYSMEPSITDADENNAVVGLGSEFTQTP